MKKFGILFLAVLLAGCQKGNQGPTGPQGPNGSGAPGEITVTFETGLYPDAGYPSNGNPLSTSGCYPHWLDASNPNTAPGTGEIRVASGATVNTLALGLVRFNLSYGVPANAILDSCTLELTTKTTSSLSSGSFIVGAHQVLAPPGNAQWYSGSTWNDVQTSYGWDGSTNPVSIAAGTDYASSTLDTATVTQTQINGNQVLLGWNIPPSLATVWLDPTQSGNYGLLLSFEPQIAAAGATISFWDNTGSSQQKPKMVVNYHVP